MHAGMIMIGCNANYVLVEDGDVNVKFLHPEGPT